MHERQKKEVPGVAEMRLQTISYLQQANRNVNIAIFLVKIAIVLWLVIFALKIYVLVQ